MASDANPSKTSSSSRERDGVGRVTMDPPGLFMYVTPDAALLPAVTATEQHFILGHHGIARCSEKGWTLRLTDAAGSKTFLSLQAIKAMPAREVCAALECAGNPEDPDKPSRIVSNAVWRGPPLRSLLALMPAREAAYVWSCGVDWGGYAGEATDDYVKDLPIAKAMDEEVIVAYEMNGAPLPPEHGFPLRLVVPGYYGTNSVKWLAAISLHNERPRSLYTTRLYNDWRSGEAVPVWEVAVNSKLLVPAAGASLPFGVVEILGRAWGHAAIRSVELSVDGGGSWFEAELDPVVARHAWRTFRARWRPPVAAATKSPRAPAMSRGGYSRKACTSTRSSACPSPSSDVAVPRRPPSDLRNQFRPFACHAEPRRLVLGARRKAICATLWRWFLE